MASPSTIVPGVTYRWPLSSPGHLSDIIFVAKNAELLISQKIIQAAIFGTAASPGSCYVVSGSLNSTPQMLYFKFDCGFHVAFFPGTQSVFELLEEVAASTLGNYPGVPGRASNFGIFQTTKIMSVLQQFASDADRITLAGHSLGGQVAQIAGAVLLSEGFPVKSIITLGSPKIGDSAFLGNLSGTSVENYELTGDIVPMVPTYFPKFLVGLAFLQYPVDWEEYAGPLAPITLTPTGGLSPGHTQLNYLEIGEILATGQFTVHYAQNYAAAAIRPWYTVANMQPFAQGYEKSFLLGSQPVTPPLNQQQIDSPVKVPSCFTNKMVVYLSDLSGNVQRIGEATDDPPPSWTVQQVNLASGPVSPCCPSKSLLS